MTDEAKPPGVDHDRACSLSDKLVGVLETVLTKPDVTAAELNVVRQYLKDNNITVAPPTADRLASLLHMADHKQVPFRRAEGGE